MLALCCTTSSVNSLSALWFTSAATAVGRHFSTTLLVGRHLLSSAGLMSGHVPGWADFYILSAGTVVVLSAARTPVRKRCACRVAVHSVPVQRHSGRGQAKLPGCRHRAARCLHYYGVCGMWSPLSLSIFFWTGTNVPIPLHTLATTCRTTACAP